MTRHQVSIMGSVFAVLAFVYGVTHQWARQTAGVDERGLNQLAAETNKQLPRKLDETTQLTHVNALPRIIVYEYTVVDDVARTDHNAFAAAAREGLVRENCGNPQLRDRFLKYGVSLRHSYSDRQGVLIASIDITPADCGL